MEKFSTTNCFEEICSCSCNQTDSSFDEIIKLETRFKLTLFDICHSNIGWFTDKSISNESYLDEWNINTNEGVYFLWHKDAYCELHNLYHMKCLYVGKGKIISRLINHFKNKDFSEELLVYFTFFNMPNRQAKYIEQLILDIYDIPNNKYENKGEKPLCMYFTQVEVD